MGQRLVRQPCNKGFCTSQVHENRLEKKRSRGLTRKGTLVYILAWTVQLFGCAFSPCHLRSVRHTISSGTRGDYLLDCQSISGGSIAGLPETVKNCTVIASSIGSSRRGEYLPSFSSRTLTLVIYGIWNTCR